MSKPRWHKGPPPSVGWWPASVDGLDKDCTRWWNGAYWSVGAWPDFSVDRAARAASLRWQGNYIQWRDRPDNWPERSKT